MKRSIIQITDRTNDLVTGEFSIQKLNIVYSIAIHHRDGKYHGSFSRTMRKEDLESRTTYYSPYISVSETSSEKESLILLQKEICKLAGKDVLEEIERLKSQIDYWDQWCYKNKIFVEG